MKNTHWKPCVEVWSNFYRQKTGQSYVYAPVDFANLKSLLKKIQVKITERGMEITDENIINSLNGFLYSVTDRWMLEHLEIKNINSNFNSLYVKAISNTVFNRREKIDEIIRSKYGHS